MQKITIEIASYPKSGNTWFRYLLADFLKNTGQDSSVHMIPDIHKSCDAAKSRKFFQIDDTLFSFYKSHRADNEKVGPDVVVYIYRHPLDVFMSVLNWFYLERRNGFFRGGVCKAPDDILRDGEIGFYFDQFIQDLGSGYFTGMLGGESNYEVHTNFVFESPKCVPVKYEDMLFHRELCFAGVMRTVLGMKGGNLWNANFDAVDDITKRSKDPFFWKSKAGTYKEYLSEEMILAFYNKRSELLSRLGYGNEREAHAIHLAHLQ